MWHAGPMRCLAHCICRCRHHEHKMYHRKLLVADRNMHILAIRLLLLPLAKH